MTIDELRYKANALHASKTNNMSMTAVSACQSRIDLINKAIAAEERAQEAAAVAAVALEECVKWG